MKNILIKLIILYQKTPGRFHNNCKFYPTCSEYAKIAINKYGSLKGSIIAIKRILKCNPMSEGGVDLLK